MKIKKIRMEKYKRFFDLTIDLGEDPKRIVALVGPNGCGKSCVFDAMLFREHTVGFPRKNKNYEYHSLDKSSTYNNRKIDIDFEDGNFSEVKKALKEQGKEYTIFSFRSAYRYNSNLKVKVSKAVEDIRLNKEGAGVSTDIDDRMESNYRRIYAKINALMRENKDTFTLGQAENELIGDLNKSLSKCLNLEINSLGNIDGDEGSIYFKKNDSENIFDYNVLSAGEKEIVDIFLDLYLRKEEYNNSIYIIDEPELHINTSIQRKMIIEINKIIPENCQIWIATHSIGFLRALKEELNDDSQIIEFKEENNWATQQYVLYPIKKNKKNWKELLSVALDDLTDLIIPKTFIYCEGQAFDEKVYNAIFEEKYPDVLFVSSGGNTELDQRSAIALTILSKALNDVEILVLKDMDIGSGKKVDEVQRQIYLNTNPSTHRVLKRYEIENYLFDKEVLKKYCLNNKLSFNKLEYDSCVTDIVNQNLKDQIGMIRSICGINSSINPEMFKLQLAECITKDTDVYKELETVIFIENRGEINEGNRNF